MQRRDPDEFSPPLFPSFFSFCQLVELGYRGNGEILRRDEFEARKEAAELARQQKLRNKPKKMFSAGKARPRSPFITLGMSLHITLCPHYVISLHITLCPSAQTVS